MIVIVLIKINPAATFLVALATLFPLGFFLPTFFFTLSSAFFVRGNNFFPLSLTRFFNAVADFFTTRFPTVFAPDTAAFTAVLAFFAYFAPFVLLLNPSLHWKLLYQLFRHKNRVHREQQSPQHPMPDLPHFPKTVP